jgi:hypothetical protein
MKTRDLSLDPTTLITTLTFDLIPHHRENRAREEQGLGFNLYPLKGFSQDKHSAAFRGFIIKWILLVLHRVKEITEHTQEEAKPSSCSTASPNADTPTTTCLAGVLRLDSF